MVMQIRSGLGLNPWDVLHEGLTRRTSSSFGLIVAITGAVVLAIWIPLRQRAGIGTVANIVVIAGTIDVALAVVPTPTGSSRIVMLVGGVLLNGVATAAYVGARLGPGPRDGLMTGLAARTGVSIRLVRTLIEILVLSSGWLLGGTVGAGTLLYALTIGPLTQALLPLFAVRDPSSDRCELRAV
jgi:uncharacterized membrane protein YczE